MKLAVQLMVMCANVSLCWPSPCTEMCTVETQIASDTTLSTTPIALIRSFCILPEVPQNTQWTGGSASLHCFQLEMKKASYGFFLFVDPSLSSCPLNVSLQCPAVAWYCPTALIRQVCKSSQLSSWPTAHHFFFFFDGDCPAAPQMDMQHHIRIKFYPSLFFVGVVFLMLWYSFLFFSFFFENFIET